MMRCSALLLASLVFAAAGAARAAEVIDYVCDAPIGEAGGHGVPFSKPYVRISGVMRAKSFSAKSGLNWAAASVGLVSADERRSTVLRMLQNGPGMQEYNLGEAVQGDTTWLGAGEITAPVRFVIDVAPRVGARFTIAGIASSQIQPAPTSGFVVYSCQSGVFDFENLLIEQGDAPLPPLSAAPAAH
jgi:hypothetical protein